ncbi:hypothetical protein E3P81_02278 [Wallemia ichthyophaga]|nr:hypothetical protein E3P98_02153 [Wallemia ichthyophaga]TIA90907.1 hypothetical protein E3P97_02277 [Wallemia ichthyophaga]TIB32029.1 hypothetical protein E3P85_01999 [Wallemia ichthyophaga]TIB46236.1 hypothetical protein E3P82_02275 [Wallemia ichthyophaga]TIB50104.1 hypothetical protein E3P81_02278 [Wallemia ichthyophaga]
MPPKFPNKSVHYLRLNGNAVMQCIVYLDNKHLEWFSRRILECVIRDIRKLYMPKLLAELQSGKAELDTYRNQGYQFAYYFKPTRDKQGVVSKAHQMTYIPSSKRTVRQKPEPRRNQSGETAEELFVDDDGDDYDDAQFEEKPKPKVNTSYKMNKLFSKTLCIIIEPFPSLEESHVEGAMHPPIMPSPSSPPQGDMPGDTHIPDSLADPEDIKPDINTISNSSPQLPSSTQALFNDFNLNNPGSSLSFSQMVQNDHFGDRVAEIDEENDVMYE